MALSGGGSRAIAFHLGCLRALNRLGLLDRVAVLSTVSGGSVIGAYFHAHQGDFASFEAKIRALLAQGLVAPMRRKLFSALGIKVAAAFIVVGLVALGVALIKTLVKMARAWSRPGRLRRISSASTSGRRCIALPAGRPCSKRPSTIYCSRARR